jgi:hypothetical protein
MQKKADLADQSWYIQNEQKNVSIAISKPGIEKFELKLSYWFWASD